MAAVPRLFPNRTIFCVATGPSLCQADVDQCRGYGPVIAINDAVAMAPWADVLYACDKAWWEHHPETQAFSGMKFSLQLVTGREDIITLQHGTVEGLSSDPRELCTGKNSGYQAINLAVHLGAARVVLLGYDMQPGAKGALHFFGRHAWHTPRTAPPPFSLFLSFFPSMVKPLSDLQVEVVNCSRRTALTVFPQMPLEQALARAVAA